MVGLTELVAEGRRKLDRCKIDSGSKTAEDFVSKLKTSES